MDANCARKLLKLLVIPGEPYDFGCKESETKKFVRAARKKYPEKGICIVRSWMILDFKGSKKNAGSDKKESGQTRLYSGYVELDLSSRFVRGTRILTTQMSELSSHCLFITSNTVYILSGEGFRKSIDARKICPGAF